MENYNVENFNCGTDLSENIVITKGDSVVVLTKEEYILLKSKADVWLRVKGTPGRKVKVFGEQTDTEVAEKKGKK